VVVTCVAVALVAIATALGVRGLALRREFDLPARLRVDEIVEDLPVLPEPSDGGESALTGELRAGWIRPSHSFRADGGYRRALIAPPPSLRRYRRRLPAHAVLTLAVGVEGTGERDRTAAGVRFTVSVDGREVFSRTVNPAARRRDRRWFDERIDLGIATEREAEIAVRTERAGDGPVAAGTAGWSDLRIVRETWRERQPASAAAPNVLMILVDALRADRLGCYGARPTPSPALDRLAERAVVFENMVAQSSWTMPSVATIMTGLHPRDHGVEGWDVGALSDALPTIAQQAAMAGITTFGASSNPLVSRRTNFSRGFETFVDVEPTGKDGKWAPATDVTRPFLRWLERNHGHRFFAYLHFMEPHDPYTPPEALRPAPPDGVTPGIAKGQVSQFAQKIANGKMPPLSAPETAHLRALYDGEIRAWDAALADLLAAIAPLAPPESTVLIVTADHGEEFQEHGRLTHGFHLYDESIHVPLVVAHPALAPRREPEQAQGIDLFPTIAALLGVAAPDALPGRDLLRSPERRPAFSETHHGLGVGDAEMQVISVRTDGWKLIHTPATNRFELYDLVHDPSERDDRFATAAEGGELVRLLGAWEAAAPPRPQPVGPDPALREKLRALGYVP
jgi:arylsulfatase A-like enzyme